MLMNVLLIAETVPVHRSNPLTPFLYILIIAAVVICILIVKRTDPAKLNQQLPTRTVPAKLVQKKIVPQLTNKIPVVSSAVFMTESGEYIEFRVNPEFDLEQYNEGDSGNLTYQGGRIIGFERTHHAHFDKT